jgi:hypothetical protein
VGHNGEAALRVCVPANVVSEFIELLGAFSIDWVTSDIGIHVS